MCPLLKTLSNRGDEVFLRLYVIQKSFVMGHANIRLQTLWIRTSPQLYKLLWNQIYALLLAFFWAQFFYVDFTVAALPLKYRRQYYDATTCLQFESQDAFTLEDYYTTILSWFTSFRSQQWDRQRFIFTADRGSYREFRFQADMFRCSQVRGVGRQVVLHNELSSRCLIMFFVR